MEKWRSKSLKADVDYPKNYRNARSVSPEKKSEKKPEKKQRKWRFGNFLKRKSKEPARIPDTATETTQTVPSTDMMDNGIYAVINHRPEELKNPGIPRSVSQESMGSRSTETPGRSVRKNRVKQRIQAKRDKYKTTSSSDEDFPSSLSLRIHSEDSLQGSRSDSFNQKRTRGARTERYMKRLFTNGDQSSIKHQKCPSDILPPSGSPPDPRTLRMTFGSDCHLSNLPYNKLNKFNRWTDSNKSNNYDSLDVKPPEPPPRSFKLKLYPSTMRYSLQHSDIENNHCEMIKSNYNTNSLDREYTPRGRIERTSPVSPQGIVWSRKIEEPIIPHLQPRVVSMNARNLDERRRHSKNLEEALEELETIYNSLRLSDEDLLDRAEQRSMEEYRDKVGTVEGSVISDTSSSEMTRYLREASDCRLRDDMAYRRMHQKERPTSVDNFGSLSRMSYLRASPCLSVKDEDSRQPRSRRGTPDLTRDDVVFRSINHANNTLRIADPQPPFGIPLGPVSGAADSDYLHVIPSKDANRSSYIPRREPDVVTDDLAFRSLRKDERRSQSPNFIPKNFAEIKRVQSLSADLYGVINRDSKQSCWYRKYVRLNRPLRVSGIIEARQDVDINGNKPKNTKGRVQVNIPQESEGSERSDRKSVELEIKEKCGEVIPSFTEKEVSEYKELCRELESLIRKTSERVQIRDQETRRNSLVEFQEWEELLEGNNGGNPGGGSVKDDNGDNENNYDDDSLNKSLIDENEGFRCQEEAGENGGDDLPEDLPENLPENLPEDVPNEQKEPDVPSGGSILAGSSDQCEEDGSSDDKSNIKIESPDNSNDTGACDDIIQLASKDNKLNDGIGLASMIEGRETAL
ncbi:uncharacterized protein [Fopius arisanus]|uniref:Uncharacterized protein isoform X2 n=1 Tax=Fopius arisanus TaxID=64838 RepID=A0A9R1TIH2_9HYME|nr:PREDICTED: uncharacterized protein LOC105270617 isoform X2 [Fopius arisanus]